MGTYAGALFALNIFSNGRRLFVVKQVLRVAETHPDPVVVARAEVALAHEREAREIERRWRTARGKRSKARGNAAAIDIQLDRVVGSMFDSLQSVLVPLDPESAHAVKVRAFIDKYFPEGAAGITNAEFEDALAVLEDMNEDFAGLSEADLKELNITYHVPELARLTPQFAAELDRPREGLRFATVREARELGHEKLCELVAAIVTQFPGREDANVQARTALLGPILEANERVTARRKRRNGPDVEVDPNTGVETEDDDLVDEENPGGGGGGGGS